MNVRVLVVEDDLSLLKVIGNVFESESYQADLADSGDDGFFQAEQAIYDLIVLDVMLPGMNGIDIVKSLRAKSIQTPIILLTAKDSVEDRVKGLDAGADDYVTKPFAVTELLARTRAVLRRRGNVGPDGEIVCGKLRLAPSTREVYTEEGPLKVTAKEYELLEFLMCNQDQILTRDQIFDRIWGFDSGSASSAVDVYVHLLRKKLAAFGVGQYLHTIRGVGYLFSGEDHV